MSRRITISARVVVSLTVDADNPSGDVEVINVVRINGLPTAKEVMEALDGEDELEQLDEAFAAAHAAHDKKGAA